MKKKYNFSVTLFLLAILTTYSQDITFNVDVNGTSYPTSSTHILRIVGNSNGDGWNGNLVVLTDANNDGIFSGVATNVASGELLFQVREGDAGSTSWGTEILPSGCNSSEFDGANYKINVSGNATLNFKIGECLTTATTTQINFNIDLNGTSYPTAGNDIRIGGNIAGTGWTPDIVTLTDANNDGIYTGSITDVTEGTFLFRVWQGTAGVSGWDSGDWISDITANGCSLTEVLDANYKLEVTSGSTTNLNFKLNDCLSAPTLGNISFSVDFNGTSLPTSANHIIRVAANPNLTGWNGNFTVLTDVDNDGIYTGIAYGVTPGEILFQVLEGDENSTAWGDPISDPKGCDSSEFEGGNYKATINIGNTKALDFKLDSCLSNKSLSVENIALLETNIYPNPTYGNLKISTSLNLKEIAVYNILGSRILKTKAFNTTKEIDLNNFKSGIYTIQLDFENGTNKFIKVLKQ